MAETSKVDLTLRSVFDLELPPRASLDDLCNGSIGIHTIEPEAYPAPSPCVALEPSATTKNKFLSPPVPYTSGPFFVAKLQKPFYFKFCNLAATQEGYILSESFPNRAATFNTWPFNYLPGIEATEHGYLYATEPATEIQEDVVIIAHSSAKVFGHFVLDSLSVALMLRKQIIQRRLKVALFSPPSWMLSLLGEIGIPDDQIVIPETRIVRFRSAIVSAGLSAQTTYRPGTCVSEMFNTLRRPYINAIAPSKLFLRRARTLKRIANEPDVADVFAEAGFVIVSPEYQPVSTQLAFAANAAVTAGAYGSGHALSAMMKPGSTVIEFLPEDKQDNWFIRLAARRSLNHYIIVTNQAGEVDIDWLRSYLQDELSSHIIECPPGRLVTSAP